MNHQAESHQDEIRNTRETLERLHEEQNSSSASAPASTEVGLFYRGVQEGISVRGGQIYGNWKVPVLNRMGGMTPNETARLI